MLYEQIIANNPSRHINTEINGEGKLGLMRQCDMLVYPGTRPDLKVEYQYYRGLKCARAFLCIRDGEIVVFSLNYMFQPTAET